MSPSWAASTPIQLRGLAVKTTGHRESRTCPPATPGNKLAISAREPRTSSSTGVSSERSDLRKTGEPSCLPREKPAAKERTREAATLRSLDPPQCHRGPAGGAHGPTPRGRGSTGGGGELGVGHFLFRRQEEPRAASVAATVSVTAFAAAVSQAASVLQRPVPSDPSPLLDLAAGSDLAG